jgi:GNAT superfamily N-acetyltransferase
MPTQHDLGPAGSGPDAPSGSAPRPLTEADLAAADRTFRLAFGTFLGLGDPMTFGGDSDCIATRWRADPSLSLALDVDGELVASNFVSLWGSVGFFGPLTVRPDLWDRGIAKRLMAATVPLLDERGVGWAGLFTFADSPKHIGLYRKFGFSPQQLTALFTRPAVTSGAAGWSLLADAEDREMAISACAEIASSIHDGLDMRREIVSVVDQHLGDVVLVEGGTDLDAFAVCHVGAGSEAGSGTCYVKAAAVRAGPRAGEVFGRLLDACEDFALRRGAGTLLAGMNAARREAYAEMLRRGFSAGMQGVVMTRPDQTGYNHPGVYLIDDWR